MIYNDTTSAKSGLLQDAYYEAGANANSYPIADATRNANKAMAKATGLIIGADGRWQFESSNFTDLPIGETDLILGQQDYEFDDDYLVIKTIECQDEQGNWYKLDPIDHNDFPGQSLSAMAAENGTPKYYDKVGGSFLLYPAASYNRRLVEEGEQGVRVNFQRKLDEFTVNDTIKEPGFAKHLHPYVSLYMAWAYACAKDMGKKIASLGNRLRYYEGNELEGGNEPGAIKAFYSYREVDKRARIKINNPVKR